MKNKLKPYEEYRETAYVWLGNIPKHWQIKRVKTEFFYVKNPSYEHNPVVLSLTQNGIKVRDVSNNEGQLAESYEGYNSVEIGDICLNPMDLESGAARLSNYRGVISNAYFTIRPKYKGRINTKFYSEYFDMHYRLKIFYPYGKGVGRPEGSGGRWTLNRETFMNFPLLLPPKEEQDQIVRYLDSKLSKINKYIKAKKKQIELLKEQKQAIINEEVTKGLDPNAKMKPSGIEWLGDIPEKWNIRRLKSVVDNIALTTNEKGAEDIYLGLENVESWSGKIINASTETTFDSQVKQFKEGNILFGKLRPYLAKVTIPTQKGVCSGEFLVLNVACSYIYNEFIKCFLLSNNIIELISMSTYGAKMPRAEWSFIGNVKIGIPPLKEQHQIVDYIETKTNAIDKTIDKINKEISLITEYRTSLISDVVTGKVDVRNLNDEYIYDEVDTDVFEDYEYDEDESLDSEE